MRRYPVLEALAASLAKLGEDSDSALEALDMRRVDSVVWMTKFLLRWMGGDWRPNSNASRKVIEDEAEDDDAASAVVETWRRSTEVADRENLVVD